MEARVQNVENKHGIIPFCGNGFDNWKFRLQSVLKAQEVNEVLKKVENDTRDEDWHKKNNKAVMIIIQSIADSHLEYIKGMESAEEMISKLEGTFAKKGTCSKFYLLEELINLKYDTNSDIQNHFAKCDKIFRELKDVGSTFEESDMACFLLLSMPTEFENVVTAIRTLSENNLKIEFVKSRLLEFSVNKNSGNITKTVPSSFTAQKTVKCFKCGKLGHVKSVCGIKCFTCNKLGHKSVHCTKKKYKSENNENKMANYAKESTSSDSSRLEETSVAFCAISSSLKGNEIEWYADSGATHHYINKEEVLINKRKFKEPRLVQLAEEGKSMKANSIGDVNVVSNVENRELLITLKDVLCIPGLRVNLLSISTIEKAGFEVVCFNGKIVIRKGKVIYAIGERKNNLYKLVFNILNEEKANLAVEPDQDLWHKRFGHLNYNYLSRINDLNLVNGMSFVKGNNNKICEICVRSKQKCFPHSSKRLRSSRVLELVHTDVCGPITPVSHKNNRYFVTFVDDYSRFVMVYVMQNKNEVFKCFRDYEAKVTSLFCGKRVSKLRCDNGGEYQSEDFKKFCSEKGIQISYTPPYTPQLNGVAERMNQTLMDKARSMIMECNMNKSFWEDAVLMAAYITNRTQSCLEKNRTPYELWSKKKPNVSNMRVFGCISYARVPDSLRTKLDDKGIKCRLIGYTENGYRLWKEDENKIIHSRNVVFDENNFESTKEVNVQNGQKDSYESEDESEHENDKETENEMESRQEAVNHKSKRERKLPKRYEDYDVDISCLALLSELSNAPKTFKEAKDSSKWNLWKKAIKEELTALEDNETWILVDEPEDKEIISNRWVFRIKDTDEGKPVYKARLVARGFEQDNSQLTQIHAPVAKLSTLRVLLSLCNRYKLFLEQFDVRNAFLNSELKEKVFMKIPEGLEIQTVHKNKVCLLQKAIYGLKQAPKAWNEKFNDFICNLKFKRSTSDYCLYTFFDQNVRCYLILYVDDILLACSNNEFLNYVKLKLCQTFKMKTLNNVNNLQRHGKFSYNY